MMGRPYKPRLLRVGDPWEERPEGYWSEHRRSKYPARERTTVEQHWYDKQYEVCEAASKLWLEQEGFVPAYFAGYSVDGIAHPEFFKSSTWRARFENQTAAHIQVVARKSRQHLCVSLVVEKLENSLASHLVILAKREDFFRKTPEENLKYIKFGNQTGWKFSTNQPFFEMYEPEQGGAHYSASPRHEVVWVKRMFCPRVGPSKCRRRKCEHDDG